MSATQTATLTTVSSAPPAGSVSAPTSAASASSPTAPLTTATSASTAPSAASLKPEAPERVLLQWQAPEFIKHAKSMKWFVVAGLAVAALILYAIQTHSLTMAIAFIVLAGVYALSHHHEPRIINVKVTSLGLRVGDRKIPFNHIKAFWIVYHPPVVKTLKLLTTDKVFAELTIQLDGQEPGELRDALLKQIPEYEGRSENFIDALIRITKL